MVEPECFSHARNNRFHSSRPRLSRYPSIVQFVMTHSNMASKASYSPSLPSVFLNRHALADRSNQVEIDLAADDGRSRTAFFVHSTRIGNDSTPGIYDERMAIGFSLGVVPSVLRRCDNVALILNRPRCVGIDSSQQTTATSIRAKKIHTL